MEEQADGQRPYTVTQALNAAKRGLEKIRLTIVGEVSELSDKRQYKAVYFTVRDDACALPCLIWRNRYDAADVRLEVGALVEITGKFSCYPAKGRMQFSADRIELAGEGKLRVQVARLARKLEAEGLMDPARKRRVKALPERIAVVTSPSGKAVHDVIRTLRKRYPLAELLICGVTVEGATAVDQIISGLRCACAAQPAPDVILLVRGGGSYEDYMPFNDERLARAVAGCPIPVVTGIGHEPDNSICDMVADHRSSTPTGAAEDVTPTMEQLQEKVDNATRALDAAFSGRLEALRHRLARLADRPVWQDAHYLTGASYQTLDYLAERLARAIPDALSSDVQQLAVLGERLRRALPAALVQGGQRLDALGARLAAAGPSSLRGHGAALALAAARLDALSPLKTLGRGYSITYTDDGETVVSSVDGIEAGSKLSVQVQDGMLACTVDAVERRER